MKDIKHRNTEDFNMPDLLNELRDKQTFSTDEKYFTSLEELTLSEANIRKLSNNSYGTFEVSEHYFEALPKDLLLRAKQSELKNAAVKPLWIWIYSAAAVLALALVCYPFFKPTALVQNISYESISDDELNDYLQLLITEMPVDDIASQLTTENNTFYIPTEFTIDEQTLMQYDIDADELSSL